MEGWTEGCRRRSIPTADWTMGQASREKPGFSRARSCGEEAEIVGQFAISSGISSGRYRVEKGRAPHSPVFLQNLNIGMASAIQSSGALARCRLLSSERAKTWRPTVRNGSAEAAEQGLQLRQPSLGPHCPPLTLIPQALSELG